MTLSSIKKLLSPWLSVDTRTLGVFRVFLGLICFFDIYRRWDFINIFYTHQSILKAEVTEGVYKAFTLLNTLTQSWEVHLFFFVGLIGSIFLALGYKTKVAQIVTAIVLISIHNRATILENAGDVILNSILVWTAFLPLGLSYSVDAICKNLSLNRETSTKDLNSRTHQHSSKKITHIAYFAVLVQIAAFYLFTIVVNSGNDWNSGSAVFKIFQLDTYLTSFGNSIRDFITPEVSSILTKAILLFGYLVPLLIFFPLKSRLLRLILFISIVVFQLLANTIIHVGLFSLIMIAASILLLDGKTIEFFNSRIRKRYKKSYVLFYDSDCGICHQLSRIIKRLDVFSLITFADATHTGKKPEKFGELIQKTMILFDPKTEKIWTKQKAVGKILGLLPFGFLISWIFFVPLFTILFEKLYNVIASNRSKLSAFFGYDTCTSNNEKIVSKEVVSQQPVSGFQLKMKQLAGCLSFFIVLILLIGMVDHYLSDDKIATANQRNLLADQQTEGFSLARIISYPGLIQHADTFYPNVQGNDRTIVAAAQLKNNALAAIFSDRFLNLKSIEYKDLWSEKSQFWRKFFYNITQKENLKYIKPFENWVEDNYTQFGLTVQRSKISSFKIWSVSQENQEIKNPIKNKVYNRLIN